MATQLGLYREALLLLGQERFVSVADTGTAPAAFDDAYAGVIAYCLEQAIWNFALRITSVAQTGAGSLGFSYKFARPDDYVRLFQAGPNATFVPQYVTDFADTGREFHADVSPIFLHYVSNDATDGGGNLTFWTATFARYVSCVLAARTAFKITGGHALDKYLQDECEKALADTISLDAVDAPPGQLPFNTSARTKLTNDRRETLQMASPAANGKRPFARLRGRREGEGE